MNRYPDTYSRWQADRVGYWHDRAAAVDWSTPPTVIHDEASGTYGRWFVDGQLNTSYNALDRHIAAGFGAQPALIWDSPLTSRKAVYSYQELLDRVAKFTGALAALGVRRGDRVVIYMPMVPETLIAMLACARLGAVHCVVFGGFAARELATRISATAPVAVITASCGIEPHRVIPYYPIVREALEIAGRQHIERIVLQRPELEVPLSSNLEHDFVDIETTAQPHGPVAVDATDPLYVLYTSGTTAKPKGMIRDNGGHAVALTDSISTIFGLERGEVFWAASDVGWVVGHSYIVYAPLLAGLTTVLYEGKPVGTPDAGAFWRVIADHKVSILFTAPTAIRAIRQADPTTTHLREDDLGSLKAVFLAGERCDPPTAQWLEATIDRPVIDNWWQTETGWPISARFRGLGLSAFKPGSGGRASPGFDVAALDEEGVPVAPGVVGHLAIRLPLPPGCAPTMWNDDDGYRQAYLSRFPGWYNTGDSGTIDTDGDIWVMGRTDDVINVAGHRFSTSAIEEILQSHPDVIESAVFGRSDGLKGELPVAVVVLRGGNVRPAAVVEVELVQLVRTTIGAVAALRDVFAVKQLPKTRSGKILRATMRSIANGDTPAVPGTIEDPDALAAVRSTLSKRLPPTST